MKRILCFLLSLIFTVGNLAFTAFAKPEWPSDTGVESEAGIVMDMDSGAVLWGQNIHRQLAPASITKLLTALVVVEHANMDDNVTFSHTAMLRVDSDSGNKLDLAEGDVLSVRDCLLVLILQSSNQAANALAEHVAGSLEEFAKLMNEKAAELGCKESNFVTPSGLHDDAHLTSAYDMALIARAAFQNETLLEICSTKKASIPPTINNPDGRTFRIEHKLISTEDETSETYYPYAIAGKTGYTLAAGQTLVTYARKDGRGQISVTMKSTERTHYSDTITIQDFGFSLFKNLNISENEIDYVTGSDAVTIGDTVYETSDNSYEPSDLYFDPSAVITLPNDAAFTDATKKLTTDLGNNPPVGAVAKVVYDYDERIIGQAFLFSKTMVAAASSQMEAVPEDENAENAEGRESPAQAVATPSTPSTPGASTSGNRPGRTGTGFLSTMQSRIIAGIVLAVVIVIAVLALLLLRARKREEEQRRQRRERRRQRLADIGCSEEEFKRLLEERKKRGSHEEE